MAIKAKYRYLSNQIRRLNNENYRKIMSHPLLLLVVGAIVSSIIVPSFTRQWQDNQKQLELKTALADDINKAISDSVVTAREGETGGSDSFRNWEISKEMIGSKIEAYFSDDGITHNWNNLSSAVEEFSYFILNNPFPQHPEKSTQNYYYEVCNRLGHVLKLYTSYPQYNPINIDRNVLTKYHCNQFYIHILNPQNFTAWTSDQKYFPVNSKAVNWNALFYWNQTNAINTTVYNEYSRSASVLFNDIEDHKNSLIKVIFKLPITAFK
jgi:hypothetical protein